MLRRLWLPFDCDPVRDAGVSATDDELELALGKADAIVEWLTGEHGWPLPVRASGGNSGHALYAIDEPADASTDRLLKQVYAAVAGRFSDDSTKVDTSVGNPGRIWTLYGTRKQKGEPTSERPHRRPGSRTGPPRCSS